MKNRFMQNQSTKITWSSRGIHAIFRCKQPELAGSLESCEIADKSIKQMTSLSETAILRKARFHKKQHRFHSRPPVVWSSLKFALIFFHSLLITADLPTENYQGTSSHHKYFETKGFMKAQLPLPYRRASPHETITNPRSTFKCFINYIKSPIGATSPSSLIRPKMMS